jgi:hypothetical protein
MAHYSSGDAPLAFRDGLLASLLALPGRQCAVHPRRTTTGLGWIVAHSAPSNPGVGSANVEPG